MQKSYNSYIDVVKFIFALIILEFHLNSGLFPGGRLAVEGFFMISGYIDEMNYQHDDIPIKKYVSKKLCTLLWPYYVWAILVTGATAYIAFKSGNVALLIKTFVSRMLGYEIADNTIGSIWFLLSLFEAEICCFVLKKIRHEEIVCIVWGMGVLLYLAFPELNLLFLFQLFWIAVTFVQIGHWIYRYKIVTFLIDKVTRMKNRKWGSIFVIMLLLFSIVILLDGTFSNQKVNVVFQELGSVYLFWSVSIGWSILFFVLFEWIGLRYHFKIINKFLKENLVIIATYYYVNSFL